MSEWQQERQLLYNSWSLVNSLSPKQVLRSLVSLACQVCAELVGAVSVATVSAKDKLVLQSIPCWNSWGGGTPALKGCCLAHTQYERLLECAHVWEIMGSIKLESAWWCLWLRIAKRSLKNGSNSPNTLDPRKQKKRAPTLCSSKINCLRQVFLCRVESNLWLMSGVSPAMLISLSRKIKKKAPAFVCNIHVNCECWSFLTVINHTREVFFNRQSGSFCIKPRSCDFLLEFSTFFSQMTLAELSPSTAHCWWECGDGSCYKLISSLAEAEVNRLASLNIRGLFFFNGRITGSIGPFLTWKKSRIQPSEWNGCLFVCLL